MNKKDNKRAQDSKQRLKRAVCNLLKEVGHEKITIKSLCKEAGVCDGCASVGLEKVQFQQDECISESRQRGCSKRSL